MVRPLGRQPRLRHRRGRAGAGRGRGRPADDPRVRRAVDWLAGHQNADGGWGEDLRSYVDPAWIGRGRAPPRRRPGRCSRSQAAGERDDRRGRARRRLAGRHAAADGSWDEPQYTGTGFPGDFYINYHLYRLVFPLMALGRCLRGRADRGRHDPPAAAGLPDARAVMSQAGGENFPVASRLLPAGSGAHLLALYGFARLVDDIGDEAPGDRLARSSTGVERELDASTTAGADAAAHARAWRRRCASCAIPARAAPAPDRGQPHGPARHPLCDLRGALGYCALSADPVGQLVLHVFGVATPERIGALGPRLHRLQLVEHWQDIAEDSARGRIYLPAEDLERFGCAPSADLAVSPAPERVRALRALRGASAPARCSSRARR